MAAEIELKLSVQADQVDRLTGWLTLHAGPPEVKTLRNVYFDTPGLTLNHARAALRLRQIEHDGKTSWVQTLKTAGHSQDGLAIRDEWETLVSGEQLEPNRFPAPATAFLTQLEVSPVPVFRTDFTRHVWLIDSAQGRIEVALDQGLITLPGIVNGPAEPIRELELEWLGNPQVPPADTGIAATELRAFAEQLRALAPLPHSDSSKAERGYQLYLQAQAA